MKYIDAEKLKAEIERNIKHYEKLDRDDFKNGELYICQELLSFIKSLQQEQNSAQDTELTDFESTLFTAFSYAWQSYLRGEEVNVVQWVKENSAELLEAARFQQEQLEIDWDAFHREAAKDILCAMIHHQNSTDPSEISIAIDIADELIKQLKEERK